MRYCHGGISVWYRVSGAKIYLFRETYDDLEANLISEMKAKWPSELYKYNESKHIATLYNGTKVMFRFISSKKDADRYQGRSMDFVGVNELTKFDKAWIQILLSCLRSPKDFRHVLEVLVTLVVVVMRG